MKAFFKTLVGDTWNVAGVALIVIVAVGLTELHHPAWAVFAMPATGLAVVFGLARH